MPYVLAYNRRNVEDRIAIVARSLGLAEGFDGFMSWILDLRIQLGIPHSVAALNVTAASLDDLAAEAFRDPNTPDNARSAGVSEFREMLEAALSGSFESLY